MLYKILPLIFSTCGIFTAFLIYTIFFSKLYFLKINIVGNFLYNFLNKKWLFDKIYNEFIIQKILYFSYFLSYKLLDKGFIEFYGPNGINLLITRISCILVQNYKGYLINGLILFYFSIFFISLQI